MDNNNNIIKLVLFVLPVACFAILVTIQQLSVHHEGNIYTAIPQLNAVFLYKPTTFSIIKVVTKTLSATIYLVVVVTFIVIIFVNSNSIYIFSYSILSYSSCSLHVPSLSMTCPSTLSCAHSFIRCKLLLPKSIFHRRLWSHNNY